MKFTPVYNIAAKNDQEADMLIYGVIGDTWFGDGNPAKRMVTDFKSLEKKYQRINVHINSPGGSVHDGLPMFNAIKASKADVHTYIDGIAYSMGAMIALAGKTVHAPKGALMLIHNVSSIAMGNAMDMRQAADEMDVYDDVLSQLIADKSGRTLADVKQNWMNYQDNLMSAQTAFDNKLVDVLEDYQTGDMPENIAAMKMEDVIKFYSAEAPAQPNPANSQTPNKMFEGKFSALKALKGVAAESITAEQLAAVNAALAEYGISGVTAVITGSQVTDEALTAQVSALQLDLGQRDAEITNLRAEIAANTAIVAERDAAIVVNQAKITELENKINGGPAATQGVAAQIEAERIQQSNAAKDFEPTSYDLEKARLKAQWSENPAEA